MRTIVLIVMAISLTGCVGKMATDNCKGRDYEPGTAAFSDCYQREHARINRVLIEASEELNAINAAAQSTISIWQRGDILIGRLQENAA